MGHYNLASFQAGVVRASILHSPYIFAFSHSFFTDGSLDPYTYILHEETRIPQSTASLPTLLFIH
jgi:hypothetical protein